jgi:hypothetical protein
MPLTSNARTTPSRGLTTVRVAVLPDGAAASMDVAVAAESCKRRG